MTDTLKLLKDVDNLLTQLMPGVKHIVLQDYGFLNDTLINLTRTIREMEERTRDNTSVTRFQDKVFKLRPSEFLGLDDLCFDHIEQASRDFGRDGETARKLLAIARELMQ